MCLFLARKCCCGQRSGVISNIVVNSRNRKVLQRCRETRVQELSSRSFVFRNVMRDNSTRRITTGKWPRPCSPLAPRRPPRLPNVTFQKIKIAIQKLIRGCIRPSIYLVSFAKRTKQHASRKSKFRNASRYHERARRGQNRKWVRNTTDKCSMYPNATQKKSELKTIETVHEGISSYWPGPRRPNPFVLVPTLHG